jgi:Tfp pilus assembly protein PilV
MPSQVKQSATINRHRGFVMLEALVFGSIFVIVLGALASFSLTQNKVQTSSSGKAKGLALAEAGLEYYRWHLAHFPTDLKNGTNAAGPYVITQNDPEGGPVGTSTLTITANQSCGVTTSIDIASKGVPNDGSNTARTIKARYAQPTVAQYSYVLNDSAWVGSTEVVNGPFHSNGGVRMDGTANAPVTSSLATWTCTPSFGCSPSATKNGVFGSGPNSSNWSFPTPQVDFAGIAADFTNLKNRAQAAGLYFPRYSNGNSNSSAYWKGYHLTFAANGTVTVTRVTSTNRLTVVTVNPASKNQDNSVIQNEVNYGTYTTPSSCGLIFVEDNVWVDGVIPQKVTIVAANTVDAGVTPNAYLPNNITYSSASSGLTLVAQNDILIAGNSPNSLTLNGIFIAQGGAFGRNLFACNSGYEPRNLLTMHGTTVSNKTPITAWLGPCGGTAGYPSSVSVYDRTLSTDPPPFTPILSTDFQFVDWREQ